MSGGMEIDRNLDTRIEDTRMVMGMGMGVGNMEAAADGQGMNIILGVGGTSGMARDPRAGVMITDPHVRLDLVA